MDCTLSHYSRSDICKSRDTTGSYSEVVHSEEEQSNRPYSCSPEHCAYNKMQGGRSDRGGDMKWESTGREMGDVRQND